MRVIFDCGHLGERGGGVVLFDYAHGNQSILGHESIITYDENSNYNHPLAIARFTHHFQVVPYRGREQFSKVTASIGADLTYHLKSGRSDGRLNPNSRNAIHAVFQNFEPHGDAYAYISEWLSNRMTNGLFPFVPHIVQMPDAVSNLRAKLNIPNSAVVFARYGGFSEFNVPFVTKSINKALSQRKNIFFIFMNTEPFINSERVIFLPASVDPVAKSNFIAAADYMLHARVIGETFGLAIAEFLFHDRPVIAWAGGHDRNHVTMIGNTGFFYKTSDDLLKLLLQLDKPEFDGSRRARVSAFSPQNVMQKFSKVFIDPHSNFPKIGPLAKHYLRARRSIAGRFLLARQNAWI